MPLAGKGAVSDRRRNWSCPREKFACGILTELKMMSRDSGQLPEGRAVTVRRQVTKLWAGAQRLLEIDNAGFQKT